MPEIKLDDSSDIRPQLLLYFGHSEMMVNRYIQLYGNKINMRAIQDVRNQILASDFNPAVVTLPKVVPAQKPVQILESPVFTIDLGCPSCRSKGIKHNELRASSLVIRSDAFLAPVYFSIGKYMPLNYLSVAVAVCPRCLFASPDKKDFVQFNMTKRQFVQSQISPGIMSEIRDTWAARKLIQDTLVPGEVDYFICPRPLEIAILTYRLADQRASVEAASKAPFSMYKRANYWLRIALLERQAGKDDTLSLQKALEFNKEAFFRSDFPSPTAEYQTCFVIFSLYLCFAMLKEARDYLSVMEQSRKPLEERKDTAALQALDQWLNLAKSRWEDRDNPALWALPTKP